MLAPSEYIHKWSWNVLIVLDACRYDYFVKLNPFKGRLTKLEVKSMDTITWLRLNFPDKYPYVYVSASPFCNSKVKVSGFFGGEHFKKVVDVWKDGWDENLKTVPPNQVTKHALPYINEDKLIIHYMQPHFPSIGKTRVTLEAWRPEPLNIVIKGYTYPEKFPPLETIKQAYQENLEIVMSEVKNNLFHHIPQDKKVVITSDHSELLGEHGYVFHPVINDSRFKDILNVNFWFEVERC